MTGNQLPNAILGIRELFFSSRLKLLNRNQAEVWELSTVVKTSSRHKEKCSGKLRVSDDLLRCSLVPKWSPFMFHCLFLSHVASVLMPDSIPCCTTLWRFDSDLLRSKAEFLHVHKNITVLQDWCSGGMQAIPSFWYLGSHLQWFPGCHFPLKAVSDGPLKQANFCY